MNAVGIVAEYNPIHNGHIYHINQARSQSGCECVVVALSGNFVQRGEPAIIDKWSRAELAVKNGADLVVEIPTVFALGNAGQYAAGGVGTLESLGKVTYISFGSESGNVEKLMSFSRKLQTHEEEVKKRIGELIKTGVSYPIARSQAYKMVINDGSEIPMSSNDVLAIEYLKNLKNAVPIAVERKGAGYNDFIDNNLEFQSASGIRNLLKTSDYDSIKRYVPSNSLKTLEEQKLCNIDDLWNILRFTVISSSAEDIDECPAGGEGLGNLMKSEIYKADSYEAFINAVKSKRYTYTRISRLCMQLILGVRRDDPELKPGYIRILGFNEKGRALLKEIRNEECSTLPVLTNINKERNLISNNFSASRILDMDIHAANVYNLVTGRDIYKCSDYRKRPYIAVNSNMQ